MSGVDATQNTSILDTIVPRLLEDKNQHSLVRELVQKGFEQKLMELYEEFQEGECSLGYLAEQLGITSWEAVHLLEERGLRTSNL